MSIEKSVVMLEYEDILKMYSDLILKYNDINKRSAVADKQLSKMLSEYAELLLKKDTEIIQSNISPIQIEIVKSKKK